MAKPRARSKPGTKHRKALLIVLDGLGDRPVAELGGRTPLEAAASPNLDRLARDGQIGMLDPIAPGLPVGTHVGMGVLMGLPPMTAASLPRGPVEAAGTSTPLEAGDVAIRCNFASFAREADALLIQDRRAGRIRAGTSELCADLRGIGVAPGVEASLFPATEHRAVLRLRGTGLSGAISDTDPGSGAPLPSPVVLCEPLDPLDPAASRTAGAVNRFLSLAHDRLEAHPVNLDRRRKGLPPANGLLSRGSGTFQRLRSVVAHFGLQATVVTDERTIVGLTRLCGFKAELVETGKREPHETASELVELAQASRDGSDLVILHYKAPDLFAHDRNPTAKRRAIEALDAAMAPLIDAFEVIGVTGDHSTPCATGAHSGDPVPGLIYAEGGRVDGADRFGEGACMTGGLGRIRSTAFLSSLLDAAGALGIISGRDLRFFG